MSAPRRLRLGVLVSGTGRTLENFAALSRSGLLRGEVVLVISSSRTAYALERAALLGLPALALAPRSFPSEAAFAAEVFRRLEKERVDLALLAGFLARLPIARGWRGRVMNIHPALLPGFGGKGFYGLRVHEAVRAAGVKVSGCTVHFADDEYDHGPIILQRTVPVSFEDSAEDIAHRVFEQEKTAYPEAVNLYAAERLLLADGRVQVLP